MRARAAVWAVLAFRSGSRQGWPEAAGGSRNLVVCSHPSVTGGTFGAGPLSPATPAVSDVSPVRFGRRAGGAWRKFQDTIPTMYGSGRAFSGSLLLLPVNGWADQANCFDVGRVTFDRAHLLAVAACPVDAEHVAAEKRRARPGGATRAPAG